MGTLKTLMNPDNLHDSQWNIFMREMSVREANQNFGQVIAAAERGETVIITKNGVAVAKVSPQSVGHGKGPEWQKSYNQMVERLRGKKPTGLHVGTISEDDLYG